jgi:hypothetical protein
VESEQDRNTQRSTLPVDHFHKKSSARVWDYWLGGTDNYQVDRAAGDEFTRLYPDIIDTAQHFRQFLTRAVGYLAGRAKVRQFLDIGTGLPGPPGIRHTHEVAQSVAPTSKIVYVDNDPLVLLYASAWLSNTTPQGTTDYLHADVRDPDQLLAGARATLDFTRPVAVMLLGILGHAAQTFEQMYTITRALVDAVPSGSYLILGDGAETGHPGFREASRRHRYHLRRLDEFRACLIGLEIIEPGLVPVNHWRPATQIAARTALRSFVAVARKPVSHQF